MSYWSFMAAMDASAAASEATAARKAVEELREATRKNAFIANLETIRKMLVDIFHTGNCDITKVTEIKSFMHDNFHIAINDTVYLMDNPIPEVKIFNSNALMLVIAFFAFLKNYTGFAFLMFIIWIISLLVKVYSRNNFLKNYWKDAEAYRQKNMKIKEICEKWQIFKPLTEVQLYGKGFLDKVLRDTFILLSKENEDIAKRAKLKLYSILCDIPSNEIYLSDIYQNDFDSSNIGSYISGTFCYDTITTYKNM